LYIIYILFSFLLIIDIEETIARVRENFHSRSLDNESTIIPADNKISNVVPKSSMDRQIEDKRRWLYDSLVNKLGQMKRWLLRFVYTLDMNLVAAYFILGSTGVAILAVLWAMLT